MVCERFYPRTRERVRYCNRASGEVSTPEPPRVSGCPADGIGDGPFLQRRFRSGRGHTRHVDTRRGVGNSLLRSRLVLWAYGTVERGSHHHRTVTCDSSQCTLVSFGTAFKLEATRTV